MTRVPSPPRTADSSGRVKVLKDPSLIRRPLSRNGVAAVLDLDGERVDHTRIDHARDRQRLGEGVGLDRVGERAGAYGIEHEIARCGVDEVLDRQRRAVRERADLPAVQPDAEEVGEVGAVELGQLLGEQHDVEREAGVAGLRREAVGEARGVAVRALRAEIGGEIAGGFKEIGGDLDVTDDGLARKAFLADVEVEWRIRRHGLCELQAERTAIPKGQTAAVRAEAESPEGGFDIVHEGDVCGTVQCRPVRKASRRPLGSGGEPEAGRAEIEDIETLQHRRIVEVQAACVVEPGAAQGHGVEIESAGDTACASRLRVAVGNRERADVGAEIAQIGSEDVAFAGAPDLHEGDRNRGDVAAAALRRILARQVLDPSGREDDALAESERIALEGAERFGAAVQRKCRPGAAGCAVQDGLQYARVVFPGDGEAVGRRS